MDGTLPTPNLSSRVTPVAVMLGLWLAALATIAGRVPLWANAPRDAEVLALQVMAVAVGLTSGLVLPVLAYPGRVLLPTVACAGLVLVPAGHLSAAGWGTVGWTWLLAAAWGLAFASLGGGPVATRHRRAALAGAMTVVPVALAYAAADYGPAGDGGDNRWWSGAAWSATPILGLASTAEGRTAFWGFGAAGLIVIGRIIFARAPFLSFRRQLFHESRPGVGKLVSL